MLQYPLAANNLFKLRNRRKDPGVIERIVKYTKTDRVRIGKKNQVGDSKSEEKQKEKIRKSSQH